MDFPSLALAILILQVAGPADDPPAPRLPELMGKVPETPKLHKLEDFGPADESRLRERMETYMRNLESWEPEKIGAIRVAGNNTMPRDYIVRMSGLIVDDYLRYPEIELAKAYLLRSGFFVPDLEQTDVSIVASARGKRFRDVVITVRETEAVSQSTKLAICVRILVNEWESVTWSARRLVEHQLGEWLGWND